MSDRRAHGSEQGFVVADSRHPLTMSFWQPFTEHFSGLFHRVGYDYCTRKLIWSLAVDTASPSSWRPSE
ncbi:unnamed protein product [Arctogadus glacialis]